MTVNRWWARTAFWTTFAVVDCAVIGSGLAFAQGAPPPVSAPASPAETAPAAETRPTVTVQTTGAPAQSIQAQSIQAQPPSNTSTPTEDRERKAAAEVLFEEGKDLVGRGLFAQGCSKFEESQNLDAGIGTQFNLADCYERLGRLASAYALFMEVASTTRLRGQLEREAVARERAVGLKPRLSRLVIVVDPTTAPPGISVVRNGTPVGAAQWGVAIPVDPGQVKIMVTAPDRRAWEITVEVRNEGSDERIVVPGLEPTPPMQRVYISPVPVSPPESEFLDQPKNWLGLGLGGVGVVGLGLFTYFGLESQSKYRKSDAGCDANDECSPNALATRQDAYDAGVRANVSLAVGAGGLIAGAVLLLLNIDSKPQSAKSQSPGGVTQWNAAPVVGNNTYGAAIRGAF